MVLALDTGSVVRSTTAAIIALATGAPARAGHALRTVEIQLTAANSAGTVSIRALKAKSIIAFRGAFRATTISISAWHASGTQIINRANRASI